MFTSFWGYFGWWSVPLSPSWYVGLAAICLAAGLGIVLSIGHWIRRPESLSTAQQQVLLLFGIAVLLAIIIAVAQSLARFSSPTFGRPQGRYLFPALVPMATLFVLGLRGLVPKPLRLHLLAMYAAVFALFDALCIALYIIPAYYSY
jgi:ABC-type proline/glycine betaine transport system permease subunit